MTEAGAAEPAGVGALARLCVAGAAVGLVAGAGAVVFVAVQHHFSHLLWHTLPDAMGLETAPWWMVIGFPLVGAVLTWAALQLPGHGGHAPLDGIGLDIGPDRVLSVLAAALASLCFGAVLGPEAPLLAIGTAAGIFLARAAADPVKQVMAVVGAMAAMGAILGNPLVTAIMLLEFALAAGSQMAKPAVLLPALSGLGSSYLLQVGLGPWSGLGEVQLSMSGLNAYPNVRAIDLLVGVGVALVVGLVIVLALRGAGLVARVGRNLQLPLLLAAAAVTGLAAVLAASLTGQSYDLVLFAGQSSMSAYLALPTFAAAAVLLVAKFVGYTACLGGGFRGGMMFPALALGAIVAAIASLFLGEASIPALAATGIAAGTAAVMRLPFTAVLMSVMLTITAGAAVTVPAILGAVIGMLVRLVIDHRAPARDGAHATA